MLYYVQCANTSLESGGFFILWYTTREGLDVSSETKQETWVETWARRIETLGLSAVALSLLEIVRAFGFVGSQALLLAQPLMTGIVDDAALERSMTLLDSPELLDRFRDYLEEERS